MSGQSFFLKTLLIRSQQVLAVKPGGWARELRSMAKQWRWKESPPKNGGDLSKGIVHLPEKNEQFCQVAGIYRIILYHPKNHGISKLVVGRSQNPAIHIQTPL